MNQRTALMAGTCFAGLGVIFGAFGAHALKSLLIETGRSETYELAVRYQLYHAFALVVAGLLMDRFDSGRLSLSALFFSGGILMFSGSLYILALTGMTMLGAVTPVGGVLFILGWIWVLLALTKIRP